MQIIAHVTRAENGKFRPCTELGLRNIGSPIAGTIVARLYKGIEAEGSNVVIEVEKW